jgi:hypothetical protein
LYQGETKNFAGFGNLTEVGRDGLKRADADPDSGDQRRDPLLVQAALDAVRERKYKPTTLNGEPVEVDTEIDIGFG